MEVTVHLPMALREYADGARQVAVDVAADAGECATLGRVLEQLRVSRPGVVERALDERGQVRAHVNIFVDGESIRLGQRLGLATPVPAAGEIWIIPAVSGG
jgi:molybdopterin converting factor small subunit